MKTIQLTSATQDALSAAIDSAAKGETTKIILPKGATINFTKAWSTKDITDKDIILDFNGAQIDFKTATTLAFKGSYDWVKSASSLGTSGGNTTLTLSGGIPSDLKVGDWIKVVSNDTTPGDRTASRKMGEAMEVKAISGNTVILDGQIESQSLYKSNIRVGKYNDASLTILNADTEASLSNISSHIRLETLVEPKLIEPAATENMRQFIQLLDTVDAEVRDPVIKHGLGNTSQGEWAYGVLTQNSKGTTVSSTGKYAVNFEDVRHAVDASQTYVTSPSNLASYGPDHDAVIKGITVTDSLAGAIGAHSGGWGTIYEDVTIHDTELGVTVRGRHQIYKDLNVYNVNRGIQFYNEGNVYKAGALDSYDIDIVGGTYKVSGIAFFTSGVSGNNLVDEISFHNTYFEHSGNGWFSHLNYANGDWSFSGDTFKLTGGASTLFRITGAGTTVDIDNLTLDLSSFKGRQITLFNVDSGSSVDVDGLTIINPKNVKIIEKAGGGSVDVDYSAKPAPKPVPTKPITDTDSHSSTPETPTPVTKPSKGDGDTKVDVIVIEAEDFSGLDQSHFVTENLGVASGNQAIHLPYTGDATASVSHKLSGVAAGTFDVALFAFDENDGQGSLTLRILDGSGNVKFVDTVYLDQQLGSAVATPQNLVAFGFDDVVVPTNATIEIEASRSGTEYIRIDSIVFALDGIDHRGDFAYASDGSSII